MMPHPLESMKADASAETPPTSPDVNHNKIEEAQNDIYEDEHDIHSITGIQILECQLFQNEIKDHLLRLKYVLRTWVRYLREIFPVLLRFGEGDISAMTETRDQFREKCRVRYDTIIWHLRCLNLCHLRNVDFGYPGLPDWQVSSLHHFLIFLTTEEPTELLVSTVMDMDLGLGELGECVGVMGF